MADITTFVEGIKELNIELSEERINKFDTFKEMMKEWNEKINLTAIKEDKEIDIKHFLDSLTVLNTNYLKEGAKVIDIGTGGGFPGVPLKIVRDDLDITLLDSLNKRLKYLNLVIDELELNDISTLHGRAEDHAKDADHREQYDVAIARAVAALNILSEYCLPYVKVGGYFIAMKGPDVENEIGDSNKALKELGGEIVERFDFKLPSSDITHNIVIVKKVKNTPKKYPRKAGTPKRKPL